jgi:transposase
VLKKRFSRSQLLQFLVNTPPCLIGMEASCGCHLDRGLLARTGRAYLWRVLPEVMAQAEEAMSPRMFRLMQAIAQQWRVLEQQMDELNKEILSIAETEDACRRLQTVPGMGPLAATAMVAAIGNGAAFRKGRDFSAWLGLVPKQHSTGGKTTLLGIRKRGNEYLRRLFIHGARSVCLHVHREGHAWGGWITLLRD